MTGIDITSHTRWKQPLFIGLSIVCVLLVIAFIWVRTQSPGLLPASVAGQVTGFRPVFYTDTIPLGYTIDTAHTTFDQGVLVVSMTKQGSPSVVLTEQRMPGNFDFTQFYEKNLKARTTVSNVPYQAVVGLTTDGSRVVMQITAAGTWLTFNADPSLGQDELKQFATGLKQF